MLFQNTLTRFIHLVFIETLKFHCQAHCQKTKNAFDLPKSPISRYYQGLRKQKTQQRTKAWIVKKHNLPTVSTILKNKVEIITSHQLYHLKNEYGRKYLNRADINMLINRSRVYLFK